MADLYTLAKSTIDKLRRDHEQLRNQLRNILERTPHGFGPPPAGAYIAKTDGSGIAGMSGSTPASGTVNIYRINGDGDLEDTGLTRMAYNIATASVAATTFIQIKREWASHKWIVDFEDCI